MKHRLAFLCFAALTIACDRRDRFAAPDSSAPATPPIPERSAYLSVSDLAPERGDTIVVSGTLRVSDDLSLGSFRVRLGYDSTKLDFVSEIATPELMRAVNPLPGDIVVVGASASGSANGRLFTLRLLVDDPSGINSLVLRIDELNDASFRDQKATITRAAALRLDPALGGQASGEPSTGKPGGTVAPVTESASQPVIDSISPKSGELENERVTDITIYGRGFASRGNVVVFGTAEIPGLVSESGGTIIRFLAPSVRVTSRRVAIRVKHGASQSNAVTFTAREDRR